MAQPIATHYANLLVRRDAPVGVIKASYRKLSQKYHPDRNPDPAALEIMKLINLAWDVLSDPERRARHDRAIAALERRAASYPPRTPPPAPPAPSVRWRGKAAALAALLGVFVIALTMVAFQFAASDSDDGEQVGRAQVGLAQPAPDNTQSMKADPERLHHGYLVTSVQDKTPGIAVVDIDNTAGLADVEVRLFVHGRAARSMFVHRGQRFAVEDLAPGKYVVKYKFEADGKTRAFQEREFFQPQRDKFIKLKLKVPGTPGSGASAVEIAADQF